MRSPPEPRHAPSRFAARCSAPRSKPSRPDRSIGSFPPVDRPAALVGFCGALRRFAPATGGTSSLNCRAHLPFASVSPTRSILIGVISPPANRRNDESKSRGEIRETWTLASGLHSRLRSARPGFFFLARPCDPALGFASCRVSGASFAHLGRLDPALIIKARKIASSVSAHGFGRSMWLSAAVPSANPTP